LRTVALSPAEANFFRPFGPDITALFAADCGALGIKATVTLQLVREAQAFAYGSFAFADGESFLKAMSAVAREGLASESFGFDPFLQAQRMKRDSLAGDAKSLLNMMKAQGSAWKAVKEGAKVVAAGRSFLEGGTYSLHVICEGRTRGLSIRTSLRSAGSRPNMAAPRLRTASRRSCAQIHSRPSILWSGRRASGGCRFMASFRTAGLRKDGGASRRCLLGTRRRWSGSALERERCSLPSAAPPVWSEPVFLLA
jgi:hypothetical protein